MREYDRLQSWYEARRNPRIGAAEVGRCIAPLPPGAAALDAGCGAGEPVSRLMLEHGLHVHAVDSSPAMIAAYRRNFPQVPVECAAIEDAALFGRDFAVVVAWGVLFHLSAANQARALARLAAALQPRGRLLFTAGKKAEERHAPMQGVMLHYLHLGYDAYAEILHRQGCALPEIFADEAGNEYYFSVKK